MVRRGFSYVEQFVDMEPDSVMFAVVFVIQDVSRSRQYFSSADHDDGGGDVDVDGKDGDNECW